MYVALCEFFAKSPTCTAFSLLLLISVGSSVAAETVNPEGSWSGSGIVYFPSGDSEKARCRATFTQRGGNGLSMVALCATAAARLQQTAVLERVGTNRFIGDFQNPEYGVSGTISITVVGGTLNALLSGGGGGAEFRLNR